MWVILVVVLLFTCFPPVYAHLSVALHIPISLLLVGIVLRGSAFTFRAYDSTNSPVQKHWGRIFSISSTITPVLLGVCVGALVSGALALPEGGDFLATYVRPWFTAFAFAVGGLTLTVFAFLALLLGTSGRLAVMGALLTQPWAVPFQEMTGALAVTAIAALLTRRYRLARATAAPAITLRLVSYGLVGGAFVLVPSLWYLFRVFKSDSSSAFERVDTAEYRKP